MRFSSHFSYSAIALGLLVSSWLSGAAVRPAQTAKEEAVVLTPKSSPEPRINGARAFGVKPGSPFLFTIPATGDRPMTFAADKLPKGLKIDPKTGQITGVIPNKGEYVATLKASNSLGTARRDLKIVCGDTLALTPHMGWNSWYVWENHVTDKIIWNVAPVMAVIFQRSICRDTRSKQAVGATERKGQGQQSDPLTCPAANALSATPIHISTFFHKSIRMDLGNLEA